MYVTKNREEKSLTYREGNLPGKSIFQHFRRVSWLFLFLPLLILVLPAAYDLGDPPTFRHSDLHPDRLFEAYFGRSMLDKGSDSLPSSTLEAFHDLLDLYELRQRIDDNFTIRVTDSRDGTLLELFVLESERSRYEAGDSIDWKEIDQIRSEQTRSLVDKYEELGYPRDIIWAKWGRTNQVHEARKNEEAFIMYEVRLARYLGLSLLITEIGTVETFNQDHLISSAGARGRYQMMPYLLNLHDVHHYDLTTVSGKRVRVIEEQHPLLTMEPVFQIVRGYINAVGHEIPGISAYHTGLNNVFRIYRFFMQDADLYNPSASVVDAFVWGLTDGFDTVSPGSTFGPISRGYIPSVYGSLLAVQDTPIDTSKTMLTERVQLREGKKRYLSNLLSILGEHMPGYRKNAYQRFREMNPHMPLPEAENGVPEDGDILLESAVRGRSVRFFLPIGASEIIAEVDEDIFEHSVTKRFDHDTYTLPGESEKTMWDRQYDALVQDIAGFGFTTSNRDLLSSIKTHFEEMVEADPTPYRLTQLSIIETHDRVWNSEPWERMAEVKRQVSLTD